MKEGVYGMFFFSFLLYVNKCCLRIVTSVLKVVDFLLRAEVDDAECLV